VGTIDVRQLDTLNWGPLRLFCPRFVEDIELGRYVRRLFATGQHSHLRIEAHRDANGEPSSHVYDLFELDPLEPTGDPR
jgi:hypothetical protein